MATNFFFSTHCLFSCETASEATAAILVLLILINHSYFQLNALNIEDIEVFGVCESIGIVRFHVRSKPKYSGHFDFIIDLLLLA